MKRDLDRVASIVDAVQDFLVASRHVDRLDDDKRGTEFHQAVRGAGSPIQVDDHRIERIVWINFHVDGALETLERPRVTEAPSIGVGRRPLHDEPNHPRLDSLGQPSGYQSTHREKHDCVLDHVVTPVSTVKVSIAP